MDQHSNQNYPGASGGPNQSASFPQGNQQGSASKDQNAAHVAGQDGQFGAHVARTGPQTTHGHQVGQKVAPADYAEEFTAQTLPAGSAPSANTFKPNPDGNTDIPRQAGDNYSAQQTEPGTTTDPLDFPGSTSKDVHTGLGHPGSGQTSSELHDNSKKAGGLQNVGAGSAVSHQDVAASKLDMDSPVPGASQKTTGGQYKPGTSDMSSNNGITNQLEQGRPGETEVRGEP